MKINNHTNHNITEENLSIIKKEALKFNAESIELKEDSENEDEYVVEAYEDDGDALNYLFALNLRSGEIL